MKKSMLLWLCVLIFSCAVIQPLHANAAPINTDTECTLTLHYTNNGMGFDNLDIHIYRVAEAFPDGTFELVIPYSSYPVNIHGITSQKEWKDVASTLSAYIGADHVQPYRTGKTDESGTVVFDKLETGLYLVGSVTAEDSEGSWLFSEFLMYLPTPLEDGSFDYDVEAIPKCIGFTPQPEGTKYTVIKLWKDAEYSEQRPVTITVNILNHGIVQDTVILSADNNWSYSWTDPDGTGSWAVVETDVPDHYQVTITSNETIFMITNTRQSDQPDPPPTGEIAPIWLYITIMWILGFLLVIFGIGVARGRFDEKKQ